MIESDDFARRLKMRGANVMWLLGAGCSASAGIPTAGDMIWEFKQQLYVSQKRVSAKTVEDLSNPAIRLLLQSYIDTAGHYPALDAPDEYASLFEAVWPSEGDRRSYIDGKIKGAKPSYGHYALATLMRGGMARLIWTTNFDHLISDACAKIYDSTGDLTSVALDAPDLASQAINNERWPIEIKLHGDFRSRRLKNTGDELRQQDAKLRKVFIETCKRFGLVIAGYSGRDDSVMDALEEAVKEDGAFPGGMFWLHAGDEPPRPRVEKLIELAQGRGIDGGLVRIQNFDETLRDVVRLSPELDTKTLSSLISQRQHWSPPPLPSGTKGFPIVRLNALPVLTAPTVSRRIMCNIGGHADVLAAVEKASVDIIVTRKREGVLAFGSDAAVRKAFDNFNVTEFDLYTIEQHRLRFDSAERGLLREAISRALCKECNLERTRRRSVDLLTPKASQSEEWTDLKKIVGSLSGSVPGHADLKWKEGVGVRLDWANDRLWLLMEPRIVFSGITTESRSIAADFGRERTVRRYNSKLNDLISFWAAKLSSDEKELRALGIGDGVDAVFRLGKETAYSRRITA